MLKKIINLDLVQLKAMDYKSWCNIIYVLKVKKKHICVLVLYWFFKMNLYFFYPRHNKPKFILPLPISNTIFSMCLMSRKIHVILTRQPMLLVMFICINEGLISNDSD